ncbi:MAG: polymer-forming cytoskeletal protein [Pseudomonadota bacterium]
MFKKDADMRTIIDAETTLTGRIEGFGLLEVRGTVEGDVAVDQLLVTPGGTVVGQTICREATISGTLQGEVTVSGLLDIGATGVVAGSVTYGTLQLSRGGDLDARVRNIPPTIVGDLEVEVARGAAVTITTEDLSALDPDDAAEDVRFRVARVDAGFIALADAPQTRIDTFSKADLQSRRVRFVHDGAAPGLTGAKAGFLVAASDASGGTSGAPVRVAVRVS